MFGLVLSRGFATNHKLGRLYIPQRLSVGENIMLDADSSHYVTTVMRLRAGSALRVFNSRDGEWLGVLSPPESGTSPGGKRERRSTVLNVTKQLRSLTETQSERDFPLHLFFAPIKRPRVKLLLEKATELGVDRLVPVVTQNTNANWNPGGTLGDTSTCDGNFARILIESAEQSERISIPTLDSPMKLGEIMHSFVRTYPHSRLFVCRERSPEALPLLTAMQQLHPRGPICILVGPEGGFTDEELSQLASHIFVQFVSLGTRVLRAETAAIASLVIVSSYFDHKNLGS